jgi:hypothetical protein
LNVRVDDDGRARKVVTVLAESDTGTGGLHELVSNYRLRCFLRAEPGMNASASGCTARVC